MTVKMKALQSFQRLGIMTQHNTPEDLNLDANESVGPIQVPNGNCFTNPVTIKFSQNTHYSMETDTYKIDA
jgi:hypothetical protein